jgi:hypothetical protein
MRIGRLLSVFVGGNFVGGIFVGGIFVVVALFRVCSIAFRALHVAD